MMQTDVRSVHLNQTGFAYVGRTRVRGMVATTTSTGGVIHIFDTTTAPVSASVTYARTGYTVTVTNNVGCFATGTITTTQPTALSATTSNTQL